MSQSSKANDEVSKTQHVCEDEFCVHADHADFGELVKVATHAPMKDTDRMNAWNRARRAELERQPTKRSLEHELAAKAPMGHQIIDVDEEPEYSDPESARSADPDIDLVDDDDDPNMVILPEQCDLRWFFQQYSIDAESQVAICRTHANHLAAMKRVHHSGLPVIGRPKHPKKIKYGKE